MYESIRYLHIAATLLFFILWTARFGYLVTGRHERFLLFSEQSRALYLIAVALMFLTGFYLGLTYDFKESGYWLVTKILLLIVAVFIGNYAFKRLHKGYSYLTLAIIVYIIIISFTKSLLLIPMEWVTGNM